MITLPIFECDFRITLHLKKIKSIGSLRACVLLKSQTLRMGVVLVRIRAVKTSLKILTAMFSGWVVCLYTVLEWRHLSIRSVVDSTDIFMFLKFYCKSFKCDHLIFS